MGACLSVTVYVCAYVSISVFMSGCSFVLKNLLSNSVCVWMGLWWEGEEAQAFVCVQTCLMRTVYRH